MGKYTLYQVKPEYIREYGFASFEEATKEAGGEELPRKAWEEVYTFEKAQQYTEVIDDLETIFETFNLDRPEDFKGHSMSVSDVIEAPYGLWYCDSIGFKQIKWKELTECTEI